MLKARGAIPQERHTRFSDEGTAAHAIAEAILTGTDYPTEITIREGVRIRTTYEMVEWGGHYASYVKSYLKNGGTLDVEVKAPFPDVAEGAFGTADAIVHNGKEMHVIDYKFGEYELVDVERNTQLLLYASAAVSRCQKLNRPLPEIITAHIYQPRHPSRGQPDSRWAFTLRTLRAFEEAARPRAQHALDGTGKFNASDKNCRYCDAKSHCAHATKAQQQKLRADAADDMLLIENAPLGFYRDDGDQVSANFLLDRKRGTAIIDKIIKMTGPIPDGHKPQWPFSQSGQNVWIRCKGFSTPSIFDSDGNPLPNYKRPRLQETMATAKIRISANHKTYSGRKYTFANADLIAMEV